MRPALPPQPPEKSVHFLYETRFGGLVLRLLTRRSLSRLVGFFADSRLSRLWIGKFIVRHGINMDEYYPQKYRSFNDFFVRKVRPECRPFDMRPEAFCSPCDGLVTVFPVSRGGVFRIKNFDYSASSLLGDEALAERFFGGLCVILRLSVHNYHRYHFSDDGSAEESRFLKGRLYTVRPAALGKRRVLSENCREVTLLHTAHFGDIAQVEVGATCVGRIVNLPKKNFRRGEEKGRFEFGGSTIVLFIGRDEVVLDEEFFENTAKGLETEVKCGEKIGESYKKI